jgi:hypothetical protein
MASALSARTKSTLVMALSAQRSHVLVSVIRQGRAFWPVLPVNDGDLFGACENLTGSACQK